MLKNHPLKQLIVSQVEVGKSLVAVGGINILMVLILQMDRNK